MTSASNSNLRVSVTFAQSTVFAGEDVVATITFKNATPVAITRKQAPQIERQRRVVNLHGGLGARNDGIHRNELRGGFADSVRGKGHRPTLSLSTNSVGPAPLTSHSDGPAPASQGRPRHARSISIVSLGGDGSKGKGRAASGHGRSSSAQIGRNVFSGMLLVNTYQTLTNSSFTDCSRSKNDTTDVICTHVSLRSGRAKRITS